MYHRGKYDEAESFADLDKLLREHEEKAGDGANRLFYLAIPPSVYADAVKAIRGTSLTTSTSCRRCFDHSGGLGEPVFGCQR